MRGESVLAMALAALLAGCGSFGSSDRPTAPCPRITILRDGADLTRFRPGAGQDLSVMTVDARIAGFTARCDYTDRGRAVEVVVTPQFEAERGLAAASPFVELPWFVAISDSADARIIDRQEFTMGLTFPPNVTRVRSAADPVTLRFPFEEGRRPEDYNVRLSFGLTPEELALNRRRGPR